MDTPMLMSYDVFCTIGPLRVKLAGPGYEARACVL